ncbi:MAG TPA: ATP-binding cassette domain-containing protein [Cyclobacteriaceae bacterium]|nr:ATP-binding cassette domain-containing protein [Cyclobacteriaceae bacterium]
MFQTESLSFSYPDGKKFIFPDIQLERGQPCLLLGESGSGKTTLLHLLGGLLTAQQGKIFINGTDLCGLSERARDRFRGMHIGFIFQKNHLIGALSVRENLLMAPYLGEHILDEKRADEVLASLNLIERKNANVRELSHGQAQRTAIARALMNKPYIILADEPTSALDDTNCMRVINLLLDIVRDSGSILLVATHDQRLKNVFERQIEL